MNGENSKRTTDLRVKCGTELEQNVVSNLFVHNRTSILEDLGKIAGSRSLLAAPGAVATLFTNGGAKTKFPSNSTTKFLFLQLHVGSAQTICQPVGQSAVQADGVGHFPFNRGIFNPGKRAITIMAGDGGICGPNPVSHNLVANLPVELGADYHSKEQTPRGVTTTEPTASWKYGNLFVEGVCVFKAQRRPAGCVRSFGLTQCPSTAPDRFPSQALTQIGPGCVRLGSGGGSPWMIFPVLPAIVHGAPIRKLCHKILPVGSARRGSGVGVR